MIDTCELVKSCREFSKLTQQQVSYRCGVSVATISNIERGVANPRFEVIEKLLDACGFELEVMLKESE